MDKLKLIIACAVIVGLSQLKLDGGNPQRKYYTGQKAIQQRQEAAAAGQLAPAGGAGICAGGICTMQTKSPQQAEQEALQAQISAQQKIMEEQAELLHNMQEQLNALKTQQANN